MAQKPGRPRNESFDALILRSALSEIAAQGLANFSLARVAARAGVAKGTVVLRWPNRDSLFLDAMRSTGEEFVMPDTEDLREGLQILVRQWAGLYRNSETRRLLARLEAEQADFPDIVGEFRSHMAQPANRIIEDLIRQAQARGEARADADPHVVARCLVGPLLLEARLNNSEIGEAFEEGLLEFLLAGVHEVAKAPA